MAQRRLFEETEGNKSSFSLMLLIDLKIKRTQTMVKAYKINGLRIRV